MTMKERVFRIFSAALAIAVLATLLAMSEGVRPAVADIGPKPTASFSFSLRPGLTIVDGTLFQCGDARCADAAPLQPRGPQRFGCDTDRCGAMAYGFSRYGMLEIAFSDGRKLRSNVFDIKEFNATYTVAFEGPALRVTPAR